MDKSRRKSNKKRMTEKQLRAHIQSLEQKLENEVNSKGDQTDDSKIPTIPEIQALIASTTPLPPPPSSTPVPKPSKRPDDRYHLAAAAVKQILKRSRKE